MKTLLQTLFTVLLINNLLEAVIPRGKVSRLAAGALRILSIFWILGTVTGLISTLSQGGSSKIDAFYQIWDTQETAISRTINEGIWIEKEYKNVLLQQASSFLEEEGYVIAEMDVDLDTTQSEQFIELHLEPYVNDEALVEIQMSDLSSEISYTYEERDTEFEYREKLASIWGIPEDVIHIHIRRRG